MNLVKKEPYVRPAMVKHELLRDITAGTSGYTDQKNQNKQGNQGNQGNQNTQ